MFSGADLQFILTATDDSWALSEADGRLVARNPAWVRRFGADTELPALFEADARDGLRDALARAADGEAAALRLRIAGEVAAELHVELSPADERRVRVRARPVVAAASVRVAQLERAIDAAPLILWQVDRNGIFEMSEGGQLAVLGLKPGQVVGMSVFDLYAGSPTVIELLRRAFAGEDGRFQTQVGELYFDNLIRPLRDETGAIVGLFAVSADVTAQVRAEQAARALSERAERQQRQLQAMGLPILQVWEGVLCVPVIGSVDAARAATISESVLRAVGQRSARAVILDLTGLEEVDTQTAGKLIAVLRGVELLGARGIIVGIRPSIAQTLVALGVELRLEIFGTLEDALRSCLERGR